MTKFLLSISAHMVLRGSEGCWNCQRPERLRSPLVLSVDHVVYILIIVFATRLGASIRVFQAWHSTWHILLGIVIKQKETEAQIAGSSPGPGFRIFPVHVVVSIALVYRTGQISLL